MSANFEVLPSQLYRLARNLRNAGVPVNVERVGLMLEAVSLYQRPSLQEVYWGGRATLCLSKDDLALYEGCFWSVFDPEYVADVSQPQSNPDQYWNRQEVGRSPEPTAKSSENQARNRDSLARGPETTDGHQSLDERGTVGCTGAADADILRRRDVALLTDAERAEVLRLVDALVHFESLRTSRRSISAPFGPIDVKRTLRSALSRGGDPERLYRQKRELRPRRCIMLIDVSGSMAKYSEFLLRLSYAFVRARARVTEVFTLGTRLTRVTRAFQATDPDRALARAASAIPDWHGGTRLGTQLKTFLDEWGQRGLARGAIVVIASDGWERGDCSTLAEQMRRLCRFAYHIVWCNPHKSTHGFEPTARGMRAVLPYVDDFVAGSTLNELEDLANTIASHRAGQLQRVRRDARTS